MGKVYLLGAGPGDAELLTLKAARILESANIVLHDSLVSAEVLAKVSSAAQIIDVGKRCGRKLLTQDEINSLLVSYASTKEVVVRLKGGDPLVFGRAGEELQALREADVEFEIVPGITAALGAAAAAGISLTDRRLASQILFSTFTRRPEGNALEWGALSPATTLVLYMPGPDYAEVELRIVGAGLPDDLPCVIVSEATGSQQQIRWTSVANLAREEKLPAPALLIIGRVATHRFQEFAATYWAVEETSADVKSRPAS
jgi:uroporphyrin-III C-methyltransferase